MNKSELVSAIADKTGATKVATAEAVDAFVAVVSETLAKGGDVRLVGFGTFSVAARKATTARNPRTGAKINVAASKQPKFKAGKELKDCCN